MEVNHLSKKSNTSPVHREKFDDAVTSGCDHNTTSSGGARLQGNYCRLMCVKLCYYHWQVESWLKNDGY